MRTKNKTLAIGGIEPPISSIFVDRTQRPRQTRHRHSLKYKCRKSKYIVVTYINKTIRSHFSILKYCDGMAFIVFDFKFQRGLFVNFLRGCINLHVHGNVFLDKIKY